MIDKTIKLSEHFSLGELTKTGFVTPDKNEPPMEAVENLITICQDWLEDLRYTYNMLYVLESHEDYETSKNVEGIVINQGYRSLQVSKLMEEAGLNPAPNSNHHTGCAVDIRCSGVEDALRKMVILLDISDQKKQLFDELFLERRSNICWIHFAVRPEDNRRKVSFIIK